MKLSIQVKPNSKKPGIEKNTETDWIVRVREPATEGKANEAVVKMIAEELDIPKSRVSISHGHNSKKKLVDVDL